MNKKYLYTFLIAFVVSMIGIMGIFYGVGVFSDVKTPNIPQIHTGDLIENTTNHDPDNPKKPEEKDKVLNVLAFGLNDGLADTIVLFSFNYGTNRLNILSIPRDTYHEVRGYPEAWQRKINSVYGYQEDGGVIGMKNEVSNLLNVPIDYYIKVDFSSVISIVDTLGGYDVYVPYHMKYDDVDAVPELHIDIPAGMNHLDGLGTLKFLRFRQNNDGSIVEGDVVRTQRQRDFINAMIEKALNSSDLFALITTIIKGEYVATDMPLEEVMRYATLLKKVNMDRVSSYLLPGYHDMMDGLSYWFPDLSKKDAMMRMFYSTNPNDIYTIESGDDEQ
ncbi:MAG: LCP family protein [Bacillota bacterium]|nr:LCP family protein [Bacillota bacterium]